MQLHVVGHPADREYLSLRKIGILALLTTRLLSTTSLASSAALPLGRRSDSKCSQRVTNVSNGLQLSKLARLGYAGIHYSSVRPCCEVLQVYIAF
jgi:hypothetical protein